MINFPPIFAPTSSPRSSTTAASTPKKGNVALPGLAGIAPGNGVIRIEPVSVCHQVSTVGQRPPPMVLEYHIHASGLIGSPTDPRSLKEERSCFFTQSSPQRMNVRIEVGVDVLQLAVPPNVPPFLHVDLITSSPENDHPFDRGATDERMINVVFQGNNRAAAIAAVGCNQCNRSTVGDAIANAVSAKTAKNNRMHCADARARQHCDRGFGSCRQINDDPIAFSNFVSLKDIGEAADFAM